MFTGIIHSVGQIVSSEARGDDCRLTIDAPGLDLARVALGDSIAVSGVCLTAVGFHATGFSADVSSETLSCTTLGGLGERAPVNLEMALTASTPLGGHLVSGHVDGVGETLERGEDARSVRMQFRVPAELARYIARKGSVCVDGVSLTVNEVDGACFDVNLVPHTLDHTTLSGCVPGRAVNIEVDQVARYLERLLEARESG